MQSGVARHRLFFALWPTDELRAQIERDTRALVQSVGGRVIPPANLHVTLVFLGAVPVSAVEEIVTVASGIRASGFTLEFDRAEVWSRSRVLVLTASHASDALRAIADGLQISSLQPKASEERQEYRAHVTLARDVERRKVHELPPVPRLVWAVSDFALVESKPGANGSIYSVLHRWALA